MARVVLADVVQTSCNFAMPAMQIWAALTVSDRPHVMMHSILVTI